MGFSWPCWSCAGGCPCLVAGARPVLFLYYNPIIFLQNCRSKGVSKIARAQVWNPWRNLLAPAASVVFSLLRGGEACCPALLVVGCGMVGLVVGCGMVGLRFLCLFGQSAGKKERNCVIIPCFAGHFSFFRIYYLIGKKKGMPRAGVMPWLVALWGGFLCC